MPRLNKIFKSKKGFTLVELCVVIAILAIIATMVTSFIVLATKQKNDLTAEANCTEEITQVQKEINAWIKKYDSVDYTISTSNDGKILLATGTSGSGQFTLSSDKKISSDGTDKTDRLQYITSISFSRPTYEDNENKKTITENLIKVSLKYKGNNTQTLLFSLFANTTRVREVEGR